MTTEIDNGGTRFSDWKRPMLLRTAVNRFYKHLPYFTENNIREFSANGVPFSIDDTKCPECGAHVKIMIAKLPDGNEVCWLQCIENETATHHGFSHFSRHRNRAPQGRVAGKKYGPRKGKDPGATEPATTPKPIEPIKLNTAAVVHERFADVLRLYQSGVREFMLKGPAGSGKTTIAQMLSEELKCKFVVVQGSSGTEEADLTFWRNPHDGTIKIAPGIQAAIDGPCVYLIDEGDSIMPGVLLSLNMPLANRKISINGEIKEFHPDAVFILAGNAVNGQSRQYTGRYPIDAATRDRFYEIFCDYSEAIDKAICPDGTIRYEVDQIRKKVNNDPNLSKQILPGARFLRRVAQTAVAYGLPAHMALKKTLEMSHEPTLVEQLVS